MAPAVDTLTEDHAAVYDRQLRVWGVEVQRRCVPVLGNSASRKLIPTTARSPSHVSRRAPLHTLPYCCATAAGQHSRRLMEAKVLVLGLGGLAAEVRGGVRMPGKHRRGAVGLSGAGEARGQGAGGR